MIGNKRNLWGMVTVITGASDGIGEELARTLSALDSRLVLSARRRKRLEELNHQLGGEHCVVASDISQPSDCQKIIDVTMQQYGRIDTLICCAGFGCAQPLETMSSKDIQYLLSTNLGGTIECCRLAIPIMKSQDEYNGYRGQIVIVSSACALRGVSHMSVYAASKAAQRGFAESLRVELRPAKIAVTGVYPLTVDTPFFQKIADSSMNPTAYVPGHKQSPEIVAEAIVASMRHPRLEVWPKPFSRMALIASMCVPRLTDWVMSGMSRRFLQDNRSR